MRRICFVALALIICLHVFSQQVQNTTELNILIGPSFPTSKYAHASNQSNNLGPANTGEFLKLLLLHNLTTRFGISAQLQFQRNPLKTASLVNDLNTGGFFTGNTIGFGTYPPPSPPPPPTPIPHRNWTVDNASWYVASLLIGGTAHIPFGRDNKWWAFVGAQLGGAYVTTPKIKAQSVTDTVLITVQQNSHSKFGFAYELTTGVHYRLNKNTRLALHCDYYATSKIKYDNLKTNAVALQPGTLNPVWAAGESRNVYQAVSSVNVGIGLSFSL